MLPPAIDAAFQILTIFIFFSFSNSVLSNCQFSAWPDQLQQNWKSILEQLQFVYVSPLECLVTMLSNHLYFIDDRKANKKFDANWGFTKGQDI